MAHKVGPAKSPIETKTAVRGILAGLAVIVLTIVLPLTFSQLSGCDGSGGGSVAPISKPSEPPVTGETIEPGEGKVRLRVGDTRTVKLDPERWSPWLSLPEDVHFHAHYDGWIQPWYWSEDAPGKRHEPDSTEWLGTIPSCIFRLRGQGEATLTVRP